MSKFKTMQEFRAALNGLVRSTARRNPEVPWTRAYNNPKHLAHWTVDPTFSYEEFYRANPAKARGKLNPRDPQRFTVFPIEGYAGTRWKVGPGAVRYEYAFRTRAEAEARAQKMREAEKTEDAAIVQASRSGRFGLPPHSSLKAEQVQRYAAPLSDDIERVEGGSYEPVEILRLLDRADNKSLPYVERMLDRMLERQTADERRARDAKYLNFQGFNSPDSSKAEKIRLRLSELKRAKNPGEELIRLHYKLSLMLSKYANRQLLDVMNRGADEHGVAVRTNPAGIMERSIRKSSARDLQDFVVLAQRESLRWESGDAFGGADPVLAEEWAWRLNIARDELDRRTGSKSARGRKSKENPKSNPGRAGQLGEWTPVEPLSWVGDAYAAAVAEYRNPFGERVFLIRHPWGETPWTLRAATHWFDRQGKRVLDDEVWPPVPGAFFDPAGGMFGPRNNVGQYSTQAEAERALAGHGTLVELYTKGSDGGKYLAAAQPFAAQSHRGLSLRAEPRGTGAQARTLVRVGKGEMEFPMPFVEFVLRAVHWLNGAPVQQAFSSLDADYREFLLTGDPVTGWYPPGSVGEANPKNRRRS